MDRDDVWSEAELARLRRLWDQGVTTPKIGEMMGRSKNAVIGRARRLKLTPRRTMLPEGVSVRNRRDEVAALANSGIGATEIARRLGSTTKAVSGLLYRLRKKGQDIPHAPPVPPPKRRAKPASLSQPAPLPPPPPAPPPPAAKPPPPAMPPAMVATPAVRAGDPCRWPTLEGDAIRFRCEAGAIAGAASPYCREHLARAWAPVPAKRKEAA